MYFNRSDAKNSKNHLLTKIKKMTKLAIDDDLKFLHVSSLHIRHLILCEE